MRIKDKIYNALVRKNGRVWYEYERYVSEHMEEHRLHRLRHLRLLLKLNWFYRVKKGNTPYLYWDVPLDPALAKKPAPDKTAIAPSASAKAESSPYIGVESEVQPRRTVHFLAKELLVYDVISFDVFDTLVFRPFQNPRDLFMLLDEKFDMLGFASIRQRAENAVRERAEKIRGNREVTIFEIYEEIERMTGIKAADGVAVEVQLEYELCYANPYMLRLFNLLKYRKKKIIIISDMYFTSDILTRILEKCGYTGYAELFVSCEHNSNKYSGSLFENVRNYIGRNLKYIHIGDNIDADIRKAKSAGFDAFFYENCNAMGKRYRASYFGMHELIGSAYAGIVNQHLHNGINQHNFYYEYGFIYGGLFIYGFCQWIHRYALTHKLDKVLVFARDGYVIKKVYEMLFDDIPIDYVYSSRIANSIFCAEKQRDIFLLRNIAVKASYELKSTVSDLLETFSLHFLEEKLKSYGLKTYHNITNQNVKVIQKLIIDNWDEILKKFETDSQTYKAYVCNKISACKRIAIVDTGWQGSTLLGMKWLIENKWNTGCSVSCLMAGSQTTNPVVNQTQLMNGIIEVYLFSNTFNRNNYLFHKKTYKNSLTSFMFELFMQAPHPTFCKTYEDCGNIKFQFGIPEIENYEKVKNIQQGMLDFSKIYHARFKESPIMNNISGHDAYTPFMFVARRRKLYEKYFGDFIYSKSTGGDVINQSMETMGDLLKAEVAERGGK